MPDPRSGQKQALIRNPVNSILDSGFRPDDERGYIVAGGVKMK
jgi:hypothetical protein